MARKLTSPLSLAAAPTPEQIRKVLVDMWYIISPATIKLTGDYTVSGAVAVETLVGVNTTAITVKLNTTPLDLQEVKVKRTDAQITIDGNGKTIDGESTLILGTLYDGPHLVFTENADEWSILS